MREPRLLIILDYLWAAFGLYWLAVAVHRKSPGATSQTGEHQLFRLLRLAILATAFALLFSQRLAIGFLGHRLYPASPVLAYAGLGVTLAGLGIAVWARIRLGQYWSDQVMVQADHQLIRSGPYATLRHPIYSGVLVAVAGTALVVGVWRGVLAFAILFINWTIKAKKEERILAECFGSQFEEHMHHTGFLVPRFRRRA